MPFLRSCCCWRNLRPACIASVTFILTASFVQVMLHLALYVGWGTESGGGTGDWMSQYVYFGLYVGLAIMDILVILLACLALWAEVRICHRRNFMLPLLIIMPVYLLYEAGVNIYFYVVMFDDLNTSTGIIALGGGGVLGNSPTWINAIPVGTIATSLVYWLVKLVIIVICYVVILSAYQEAGYRAPSHKTKEYVHEHPYVTRSNPHDMYGRHPRPNHYPPEFREYREKAMYDRAPRHPAVDYERDYRHY